MVFCRGDCEAIEQSGEKRDFESLLSRHNIPHEDYALHVKRALNAHLAQDSVHAYEVIVISLKDSHASAYPADVNANWVQRFEADLESGSQGG